MAKAYIIAELGSNPAPLWDLEGYLFAVSRAGADAVKLQMWRAAHFPVNEQASKLCLEFPRQQWGEFVRRAHYYGLAAGASVFDTQAVYLARRVGDFLKLAAREQWNFELLAAAFAAYPLTLYRSISDLRAYCDLGAGGVTLFALPTYPTPLAYALPALLRAARFFRTNPWGWSSHTAHWLDCWLAARLGARVIEKHFCLSSTEPEGQHSLTPMKFRQMVQRCK